MILFTILTITLIFLIAFVAIMTGLVGAIGLVIFGDVIVCIIIIGIILRYLISRKNNKDEEL